MNTNYRMNIARAALDQMRGILDKLAFHPDSMMNEEIEGFARIATRRILQTRHTDRRFFKDICGYVAKCFRQYVGACRGAKAPAWILAAPKGYAERLEALKENGAVGVHLSDVARLWYVDSFELDAILNIPYKCTKDGGEFARGEMLAAVCYGLYY